MEMISTPACDPAAEKNERCFTLDTDAWVWYAEGTKEQLPSAVLAAIEVCV